MIPLKIDAQVLYNSIMLVLALISFIYVYQKAIRDRVDKNDLKEQKEYVDKEIRGVHHRVSGIEKRLDDGIYQLQKDVKEILKLLIDKK